MLHSLAKICCNSFSESLRCEEPSEVPNSNCNEDCVIYVWTRLLCADADCCSGFAGE